MQGFGMMKMHDPFKNDPFFSGGGNDIFGKMDSMMKDMGGGMMSLDNMDMRGGSGNGGGKFIKQTYSSSTKMGKDGKPIKETY